MSAAGSHLRHLWGVYPCRGHRRPQDGDKTAADQTASPGNQLLRLGECPLPGPICGICGGYTPVAVIGGPRMAIKPPPTRLLHQEINYYDSVNVRCRVPSAASVGGIPLSRS